MEALTKYCDHCNRTVRLTDDGYCKSCGKHADNMLQETVNIDYNLMCKCHACGWEGSYILAYNGPGEQASCYYCEHSVMITNQNHDTNDKLMP